MIYIFEGIDRVGKSTQINKLFKKIANRGHGRPLMIHCANFGIGDKVRSETYSKMYYYKFLKDIIRLSDRDIYDVILDRSHIGEAVYGPMYRDSDGEYVFDFEKEIFSERDLESTYLITLIDSPENAIERDDGLSFSTDLHLKKEEIHLFKCAHNDSHIKNKLLIDISKVGDADKVWSKINNFLF